MIIEWKTEADLCQAFAADARAHGWVVYPENQGWDLLLVRRGVQVGIHAKLVANLKVLAQALPKKISAAVKGPHYRAVLIGRYPSRQSEWKNDFNLLAEHSKIIVIHRESELDPWVSVYRNRSLWWTIARDNRVDWRWYRWPTASPVWLPPFIPDLPAGVPSPRSFSPWVLASFELWQIWLERGWVSIEDARAVSAGPARGWNAQTILNRYFTCTPTIASGRACRWVADDRAKSPPNEWPELWDQWRKNAP